MVFTAKDEDLMGFKFLGSSDPEYRLIDTVNTIRDFEPYESCIDLYENDKVCGNITIVFQGLSDEHDKAMKDKEIREELQKK